MSSSAEAPVGRPGRFITFEGGEGTGKSTQVRLLAERLASLGLPVRATREPGGTPLAERYRAALLGGRIAPHGVAAEALLFAAARIDHLDRVILPHLATGGVVVCDRFTDSTRAYQGVLGHLDPALIAGLERVAVGPHAPHLTLVLDVSPEVGLARARARRGEGEGADRFEAEERGFHDALRRAFLNIATADHGRCRLIDASRPAVEVADEVWDAVTVRLYPEFAAAPHAGQGAA